MRASPAVRSAQPAFDALTHPPLNAGSTESDGMGRRSEPQFCDPDISDATHGERVMSEFRGIDRRAREGRLATHPTSTKEECECISSTRHVVSEASRSSKS